MKAKICLLIILCGLILSCNGQNQNPSTEEPTVKKGMVKVTILYPNSEGKSFNMEYYANTHMPMVQELLSPSLKLMGIDKGIAGRAPGEPIPYFAIGYLYFDKLSDYENSFGPNAEKIVGDIPNYTDVQPIVQISEILE